MNIVQFGICLKPNALEDSIWKNVHSFQFPNVDLLAIKRVTRHISMRKKYKRQMNRPHAFLLFIPLKGSPCTDRVIQTFA